MGAVASLLKFVLRERGFVLAAGAQVDEGNPDNLGAMKDAAKECGIYRSFEIGRGNSLVRKQYKWVRVSASTHLLIVQT
jgi:hypothetical protein